MPVKQRAPRTTSTKSKRTEGQFVLDWMGALEPAKAKTQRVNHELAEQSALFYWLDRYKKKHPALHWVHASLNGVPLSGAAAKNASRSGMTAGVWDIMVPATIRRDGVILYAGLYIEMKWGKNDLTDEQIQFRDYTSAQGYWHEVAYNWVDAFYWITRWLRIRDPDIDQALHANRKASITYATPDPLSPAPEA